MRKIWLISSIILLISPAYTQEFKQLEKALDLKKKEIKWLNENQIEKDSIMDFYLTNEDLKSSEFLMKALDAIRKDRYVSFENAYIETPTPDDNFNFIGKKVLITRPLILSTNDTVLIKFGITRSDNTIANQPVSSDLIEAIKFGLEKANQDLANFNVIKSIFIMATTNGRHGKNSNHYSGTAVDISGINGKRVFFIQNSIQIKKLQLAFDSYEFIRENFGPFFNHKYLIEREKWKMNYKINRKHTDHIHISVRR